METLLVPQGIDRVHPGMPSAGYNPKKHQTTSERKNEPTITLPKIIVGLLRSPWPSRHLDDGEAFRILPPSQAT